MALEKMAFAADIGISNDRIVKIGRIEESGRQVIDANGLVASLWLC